MLELHFFKYNKDNYDAIYYKSFIILNIIEASE